MTVITLLVDFEPSNSSGSALYKKAQVCDGCAGLFLNPTKIYKYARIGVLSLQPTRHRHLIDELLKHFLFGKILTSGEITLWLSRRAASVSKIFADGRK